MSFFIQDTLDNKALVLVTKDNFDVLIKCLNSIYKNTPGPYHLYIIDNASKDDTLGLYGCTPPHTTIIRSHKNLYWGGGVSVGFRLTTDYPYVFLLNDDIEVPYGWTGKMLDPFKLQEDVGLVGPFSSSDRDWQSYDRVRRDIIDLPSIDNIDRQDILAMNSAIAGQNNSFLVVRGMLAFFCVAIKREVIDQVGLLDEEFMMGGDDDDYCRRADKAGFKLALSMETYVLHRSGHTIRKEIPNYADITSKNVARLRHKHPGYYG